MFGVIVVVVLKLTLARKSATALEAKLVMTTAKAKAAGLTADKRVKLTKVAATDPQVKRLESKLKKLKQETYVKLGRIDGMTAVDVANAFSDLGY